MNNNKHILLGINAEHEFNYVCEKNESIIDEYIGVEIITNKETIEIGIDIDKQCCEIVNYYMFDSTKCYRCNPYHDNISYNGQEVELFDIEIFEGHEDNYVEPNIFECPNGCHYEMTNWMKEQFDKELSAIEYILRTSIGDIYIICYNLHNGYYSHSTRIISNTWNYEYYA